MRCAVFILMFLCCSCDPCANLDCAVSNDYGQFRIVQESSGTDLLFGPNKLYNASQLKFYATQGSDTTYFDSRPVYYNTIGYDSVLSVSFYTHPDVAYINLGNGDIDTLKFVYKEVRSRCCGTLTNFSQVRFNNKVDLPVTSTQEIRK